MKKLLILTLFLAGCASKHTKCYDEAKNFCESGPHKIALQIGNDLKGVDANDFEKKLHKSCLQMVDQYADMLDRECTDDAVKFPRGK